MVKLLYNGKDYSDYADGLDSFDYTINLTDDGAIERAASSQLKVTGKLYQLIYETFFMNACDGRRAILKFTIRKICDGQNIDIPMELPALGIDICFSDCVANIVLRSTKAEDEKYNCLKSQTNYHRKNGFGAWITAQKRNYKMIYCQDYTAITYVLLTSYTSIKLIIDLLQHICGIVDGIVNALASLFNLEKINCGKYFDQLENAVTRERPRSE